MPLKVKERLVHTDSPGDFTNTAEFTIMSCGNIQGNNNKFYCIELQTNGTAWRIFRHSGRIGKTNVYGVRDLGSCSELIAKTLYTSIVKKKLTGKKKEGYREQYQIVETAYPTVGSPNIRKAQSAKVHANVDFSKFNSEAQELLREFKAANIHDLKSVAKISIVNNKIQTPLGPLTQEQISKAKNTLDKIKTLYDEKKLIKDDRQSLYLNSVYLSQVPRIDIRPILTDVQINTEYNFLDQLQSAVTVAQDDTELSFSLERAQDERKYIDWFNNSRAKNHRTYEWKPVRVFNVTSILDKERYAKIGALMRGQRELWHGTKTSNILSILLHGLIIPPYSSGVVTGRMFGNGVYGAPSSTKALNYSLGYWAGDFTVRNRVFVFVIIAAMGKIYEPRSYGGTAPKGFDSVHAKASMTGLYNDECIVYKEGQQHLLKLVEVKKGN